MPRSAAPNSHTFQVTTPSQREIHMTRLFDAPRRLVFEVLTRPEHIRHWWGILGEGYAVTSCEVDLRPGGRWRYVSRTPQGQVAFHGLYSEVAPPERLVYTEVFEGGAGAPAEGGESHVTCTLTEEGGKTRMTLEARYASREIRDIVLGSGMERGAAISYDLVEEIARRLS